MYLDLFLFLDKEVSLSEKKLLSISIHDIVTDIMNEL